MIRRRTKRRKDSFEFFTDLAGFATKYRRVFFTAATIIYEWLNPE